jgi:hypothetical protein
MSVIAPLESDRNYRARKPRHSPEMRWPRHLFFRSFDCDAKESPATTAYASPCRTFGVMSGLCGVLLRIVRRLPTCAQLSNLAESDGQVLDNPQGRKPRRLLMPISRYAVLWGFEPRQRWMRRRLPLRHEQCVSVASQARCRTEVCRSDGTSYSAVFCSTWPRALATA